MEERICFYSKYDGSVNYFLRLTEKRMAVYKHENSSLTISDVIELYHIKKFFDNNCRLNEWSNEYYLELKNQTKEYDKKIKLRFEQLNHNNIVSEYLQLEDDYHKTFWEIINTQGLHKIIDCSAIESIVRRDTSHLDYILCNKNVVEKFGRTIRTLLLENEKSAHYILDKYTTRREDLSDDGIYFPECLSLIDKEAIIDNYLNSNDPNINYVRMISQIKDNSSFRLSKKIKYKADKLEDKLINDFFSNNVTQTASIQNMHILIDKKEALPLEIEHINNGCQIFKYSLPHILSCDNRQLIKNFVSLFGWVNNKGLINLIHKKHEEDVLESISMKGHDSYPNYRIFRLKNDIALDQINIYNIALKKANSTIELVLQKFYEVGLREWYNYPALKLNLPFSEDKELSKCRIIYPELESLVKQYNQYTEDDEIDSALFRYLPPLKITDGKSLLSKKYYEINGDKSEILRPISLLFSTQNLLTYIEPFKDKHYRTLVELLEKESHVYYNYYENFQKPHIDYLISLNLLKIDSSGIITFADIPQLAVMKSLWEFGVCSYWHHNDEERKALDCLLEKKWLKTDDHLLSGPERDYYSFYLDNRKFTNGHKLRNLYAHGANDSAWNDQTHQGHYYIFLQLLIIIILKIENDLWLATRVLAIGMNSRVC
ncbi:MAG: hypothetical protein ACRDDZ_08515 [Marinifilaceae bacterium]